MAYSKIQPSFSSGEIAPALQARTDIAKYQTGLKTLRNFLLQLGGSVTRRTGSRYIANAKYDDKIVKLISFEVSTTIGYIIEFGEYYCRFYKDKAQIGLGTAPGWLTGTPYIVGDFVLESTFIYYCIEAHTSGVFATDLSAGKWVKQDIYEIPSPYSESDLTDIKYVQSADVLFIAHPDHSPYELARYSDTDWELTKFNYSVPPFMLSNTSPQTMALNFGYGSGVTLTSSLPFFQTGHIGSFFKIYHDIDGQAVSQNFTGIGVTSAIVGKGTWRFKTVGSSAKLTINIEKSIDNGSTWNIIRTHVIFNDEINDFGTEDEFGILRLNCTQLTAGAFAILTTDPFSHAGIIEITAFGSALSVTGNVTKQFASIVATTDWAESSWSDVRGYPRTLTFYQDRLVFASTTTEPQTLWMSQTGNYYNYDTNDPLRDTDSISIALTSRKLNTINNLIFLNSIIALTSSSEWRIGSLNGVATPTTMSSSFEGSRGCSNLIPIVIGNRIIYLQPSSKIIRDLGYDYNSNSFTGDNLSIISSHLLESSTIIDLDHQKEPNSTVYLVRDDGRLITMTYLKEQEVLGFARHDTQGLYENVAVLNTNNQDQVWTSVARNNKKFIEVFEEQTTVEEDQWYLDSALQYSGVPTDTISGLDHLEGKEVYVLGDGNVIRNLQDLPQTPIIVTGGSITLPYKVEKAIVGLSYISDLETLAMDLTLPNGTIRDTYVATQRVTVVFQNSRGGFIGDPDVAGITEAENSGYLEENIDERGYMDLPIELFTGDRQFQVESQYDKVKRVFFRQYDPLPTTILAVIIQISTGGK